MVFLPCLVSDGNFGASRITSGIRAQGLKPGTISMGHMMGRPGNKSSGLHGLM